MRFALLLAAVCFLWSANAGDAAKPVSLRGHVLQIIQHGVLLECTSQDYVNNNDQTDGIDLENIQGTIFLRNHPKQGDLVDDQRVGVIAIRDGTYRYTSVAGGGKTIAAFKFVKNASSE